jgi:hypothetical protein
VQDERELDLFLDRCRRYFDWFLNDLRGVADTPLGLCDRLAPRPARTAQR